MCVFGVNGFGVSEEELRAVKNTSPRRSACYYFFPVTTDLSIISARRTFCFLCGDENKHVYKSLVDSDGNNSMSLKSVASHSLTFFVLI